MPSNTVSASSAASPRAPNDLARETLKLLAGRRMPPTPENYVRVYAEISGVEPMALPVTAQFGADFTHYYGMLAFVVRGAGKLLFDASFDRALLTDLTHGLAAQFRRDVLKTPGVILRLRRSSRAYAALFERYDLVLSPTVGQVAPPVGHLCMGLPFDVLFPRVVEWCGYTPLANATGAPSISLPLGFDAEANLPVGMMFGAAHGKDALLLQLALEIEQARPWASLAG